MLSPPDDPRRVNDGKRSNQLQSQAATPIAAPLPALIHPNRKSTLADGNYKIWPRRHIPPRPVWARHSKINAERVADLLKQRPCSKAVLLPFNPGLWSRQKPKLREQFSVLRKTTR
jgi:hypothetical protein